MITPVCCECGKEMVCIENNCLVYHPMQRPDGTELKEIDAIWWGDLYQCPVCEKKIVTGFGRMRLGLEVSEKFKKKVFEEGIKILR